MRIVTRSLVAGALALPLMVGAPVAAMAGGKHEPPKWVQDNVSEQSNANYQPITQINVGGHGDQSAAAFNDQANYNWTEQEQEQE
jgi:hypothetical protein